MESSFDDFLKNDTEFEGNLTDLSNITSPRTLNKVKHSVSLLAVFYFVRIIWSILSVLGNGLTIVAVAKFSSLQSSTNLLIASMAVADFIHGLLAPFIILTHVYRNQLSFVPLCLVQMTFTLVAIRLNFINILLIAVDRLCYIAFPLRYPVWMTNIKTLILIGITWCYIFIETSLVIYFANVFKLGGICNIRLIVGRRIYDHYFMPQFVVCIGITIFCYVAIGRIAYKQGRAIAAQYHQAETLESSILRRQKKKTKLMFMILLLFIFTHIPALVLQFVITNESTFFSLVMDRIATVIYCMNTFINPMIYAWKIEDFKVAFKKLLRIKNTINPSFATANAPLP